jgi:branched-chain amino acid transport system permease protein
VGLGQYQAAISYGSGFSLSPPSLIGFDISSEPRWYYLLLPIALLVLLINLNWLRSAFGRAWMAIHHKDVAAEALGVNVHLYKLLAFSASTSLTCFAGALWAWHTGFVSVEAFDFHLLIQYLAIVIIGGLGSVLGTILGAIFVMVLPHLITTAVERLPMLKGLGTQVFELQIGLFGVIMLLFLILEPRGLVGIWMRVRAYFQLWPFKYRAWES